ncbi:deoxyguanosinetriphosphate triphosphohydrolase [Gleimia sp. 6138-11-ORH1]|uniref:deoxyguanosinetriphosphate triphosphohydrolase n=1 Tax=Gleimia sp. 6138-11-ORH1 TaxID=2973937 RepID=UPI002169E38F|nr:deoxyguanosinetriphosphate triphosphohydrolase [Gleimia sp. 6138-11-ORH1]MCS4484209.1 deoxyguanosinetriphosphate triphosphohydrolase [Gleimia sp. 6138-11-ORH1]
MSETSYPYSQTDRARYISGLTESSARSAFEKDRARIFHSAAFRRLGAKTQVLGPISDDFIRTRLTHSLEVAQIGRALAKNLGADPDLVDAACLSHDLGHPPFGHNGERALDALAQDCGGFEGNAQTFRLVTNLEPKVTDPQGLPAGLNLTRATLDAICKYPWIKGTGPDLEKSKTKYSVYAEDAAVFHWMRKDSLVPLPNGARCIEAQIMDLADDIAYSVHDIEDAVAMGKFKPELLADEQQFAKIVADTTQWYGDAVTTDQLDAARQRLLNSGFWLSEYNASYSARAQLKDLTSELIGRFLTSTETATRAQTKPVAEADLLSLVPATIGNAGLGRYACDLIVPAEIRAEIQLLKGIAVHYVMAPREVEPLYLQQRTLLADLVDVLIQNQGRDLEEPFAMQWKADTSDKNRLRAVIDQVASLTDISAARWHARLCGLFSETY